MNFEQFTLPFSQSSSIQTNANTTQTTSSTKFSTTANNASAQVVGVLSSDDGITYLRPVETNGFALNHHHQQQQQQQHQEQQQQSHNQAQIITLPITIPGAKPGDIQQQTLQIQVVNPHGGSGASQSIPFSLQQFGQVLLYNQQNEGLQLQVVQSDETINNNNNEEEDSNSSPGTRVLSTGEDMLDDKEGIVDNHGTQGYPVVVIPNDMLQMRSSDATEDTKKDKSRRGEVNSSVAEYLSRMQGTPLPLSLHHFLKFSADTIKREADIESSPLSSQDMGGLLEIAADPHELLIENGEGGKRKKKYKKKPPKPKKPRPGQVHIATALDGTTLFCCPECNMAYPDKDMLEQHLIGHKIERRFICDICGAGLKRKEHLERHKLGHNPERPFVCSICCKGFKRKEHLNLHFVIHSGEKTEICQECGKGFYRKDHLRKHTRSHISKRLREEMQQQQVANKIAVSGGAVQSMLDTNAMGMGGTQSLEVTVSQVGSSDPPTTIVVPVHSLDEDDSNEQKPLIIPGTNTLIVPPTSTSIQQNQPPSSSSSDNNAAAQAVNNAISNMQQLLAQQQHMSKLELQLSQGMQSSSGMSKLEQQLTQQQHERLEQQQRLEDHLSGTCSSQQQQQQNSNASTGALQLSDEDFHEHLSGQEIANSAQEIS